MLADVEASPESLSGGGSTSKLTMWLLAEFNSLWTVGLKASVTHCLLPGGFSQFLAVWAFIAQITTWHWLLSEQASERARQSTQDRHHSVFITPEASLLPYSIRLKQVTWSSPHSRGGIIQGHKYQEAEITGSTLWGHIRLYVCWEHNIIHSWMQQKHSFHRTEMEDRFEIISWVTTLEQ